MAKKKGTPPPTAEYVSSLYLQRQQEGDESKLRTDIDEMRLLTDMEHEVQIPEQYRAITKEVRTPFTRDTWLRVTAALTEKRPVAHVEPREDTSEMRRSANAAERWTEAAVRQMDELVGESVVYESVKQLVRDTESVVKVVHRPDAWANFPRRMPGEDPDEAGKRRESFKKSAGLPFAWRVVDRLSMLFGDGEFGDDWALEYGEYPLPYVRSRYGMPDLPEAPELLLGGKPKPEGYLISPAGRAVKIEYWDAEWWHVVLNGHDAPGFPKPNPYAPHLPYFRAKASEPVLRALKWLVPTLDSLLTMKMNWAYLGAYPNPTLEPTSPDAPDFGEDGDAPNFEWKPGKLIRAPFGYKFGFVSPPPVGEDLNQLVTILRGLIDVAGVPSVFRGIGGADQAGYAINQLIAAANLTYKILSKVAQSQLERAAAFLWWLVANRVRQTVYVLEQPEISDDTGRPKDGAKASWLALAPSGRGGENTGMIDHLAKLTYNFRPVLPTDEQARAMIAQQLTNSPKPLWSVRHALEKMQEEDPEGIMDEMKIESYLEEPPIKDAILQSAMRQARMGPFTPQNPAAALVRPDGSPLIPDAAAAAGGPFPPGQMSAGLPGIPGLTQPLVPSTPTAPPIAMGGGVPAGNFPGQPGGVPNYRKVTV